MNKLLVLLFLSFCLVKCGEEKKSKPQDEEINYKGELIPFYSDGKYGLSDTLSSMIIEPKFVNITFFEGGTAITEDPQGSFFLVNNVGDKVSEDYDYIGPVRNSRRLFRSKGKYGYLDEKGNKVIEPIYDKAWEFSDAGGYVYKGDLNGFIDTSGNELLPLRYDTNYPFYAQQYLNGDFCKVEWDGKIGFIDLNGDTAINPAYEDATLMNNNRTLVMKDLKYALLNEKGETVVDYKYDFGLGFSKGYCPVVIGENWSCIDTEGNTVIEGYDYLFNNKLPERQFIVMRAENWGVVDIQGNALIPIEFEMIEYLEADLYAVKKDSKWQFMIAGTSIPISGKYDNVSKGKYPYCWIKEQGSWIVTDIRNNKKFQK